MTNEIKVGTEGYFYNSQLRSWPVYGTIVYVSKGGHQILFKEANGHKWEHTLTLRNDGTYRRLGQKEGYEFVPNA